MSGGAFAKAGWAPRNSVDCVRRGSLLSLAIERMSLALRLGRAGHVRTGEPGRHEPRALLAPPLGRRACLATELCGREHVRCRGCEPRRSSSSRERVQRELVRGRFSLCDAVGEHVRRSADLSSGSRAGTNMSGAELAKPAGALWRPDDRVPRANLGAGALSRGAARPATRSPNMFVPETTRARRRIAPVRGRTCQIPRLRRPPGGGLPRPEGRTSVTRKHVPRGARSASWAYAVPSVLPFADGSCELEPCRNTKGGA